MTAKDKAKELVDNYCNNVVTHHTNMSETSAISCAIICVDEIIKSINNNRSEIPYMGRLKFYKEVEQELKAM